MPEVTAAVFNPSDLARLPKRLQWEVFGAYLTAGDLRAAEAVLAQLRTEGYPSPLHLRAEERLALAAERPAAALAAAQQRAALFPGAEHQADYASVLLRTGDLNAAEQVSQCVVADYAHAAAAWAARAAVALARSDCATARRALTRLGDLEPEHPSGQLLTIRLAWAEGHAAAAVTQLTGLVAALDTDATPAQVSEIADLATVLERPDIAAALRERAATLWRQRHRRTWQAVADLLGEEMVQAGQAAQGDVTAPSPDERPAPASPADLHLPESALAIVRDRFGHAGLRPGQTQVIAQALAGVDTLAVMPTGAGKSLCYQAAALMLPGTTIVVSPLIALMKDQLDSLPPTVAAVSTIINSTLGADEVRRRLEALRRGDYKLIYVAPERLRQSAFLRAMRAASPRLLVVDEAHCISLWGHDFRPDYLFLPRAAAALGDPPLLAMTATATPRLADDIERQMRRPLQRVRTSVFRPNLRYEVRQLANKEAKLRALIELCQNVSGPTIVYAASRELCEQLAHLLRTRGVKAAHYHAGLEREERTRIQDDFMAGRVRVIVATIAFGMGVDKQDVRLLVHFSPSKSLEAYAQESGRAGRDGHPARCVLLYSKADVSNLRRWLRRDEVSQAQLAGLYETLRGQQRQLGSRWLMLDPASIAGGRDDGDDDTDPQVMIGMLERAGLLVRHPDAPRQITVRWRTRPDGRAPDPALARLAALSEGGGAVEGATFATAQLAEALDLDPASLEERLDDWGEAGYLVARGYDRLPCLELVPPPPDADRRLRTLLGAAHAEAKRRFDALHTYLETATCRHVVLAAHFGEQLATCGNACDSCLDGQAGRRRDSAESGPVEPPGRVAPTAADAMMVLLAVRTLPFPLGKSGLTRLLQGSVASPVRADRSEQYGTLAHLSGTRIGTLIERLIEAGYVVRDDGHEYRLLSVTAAGRSATTDDLADIITPVPSAAGSVAVGDDHAGEDWQEHQHALFERLRQWRAERASADGVPAYVVLHDRTLRSIVTALPRSLNDLTTIKGLGPTKIERFGTDLVAIVGACTPPDVERASPKREPAAQSVRSEARSGDADPAYEPGHRLADIRRRYPRAYETWSAEEDQHLLELIRDGRAIADIADTLQRQPSAISSRITRLEALDIPLT